MAKITNTGTAEVLFRSLNGIDYRIPAGQTVTVPDPEVTYDLVDSGIEAGYLTVTNDDDSPFFNQYGKVLGFLDGSGAGGGGGGGGSGDGLTDAQLRASPVPVTGTFTTDGLTDTQLRATPVPVSGTVTANGPLTNTQLRASAVPVSGTVTATGPLTDTQLRASAVPVSGPLTDTQLRATAVPVSGTVTATGPLTDTQLRASAVTISGTVTASGPATNAELRASPLPVRTVVSGSGNISVDTDSVGTNFATFFPAQSCQRVVVFNNTGTTIEIQQGGFGVAIPLSTGNFITLDGVFDVSQIGVRRVDQDPTVVTVQGRWEF